MTNHFNYRKGLADDFEQLKQLGLVAYRQFEKVLTKENWETLYNGLNDDEKLKDIITRSTIFLCESGKKIIGVAYFIPSGTADGFFEKEWATIRRVGVDPEFRGHGIAEKLTMQCINHARNQHEQTIALHTSEFMDAARHIYERSGFKKLKEIDPLFGKRYWIYTLQFNQ
jgi:ribosomal protein S18 acetylase RimI-like enzyme